LDIAIKHPGLQLILIEKKLALIFVFVNSFEGVADIFERIWWVVSSAFGTNYIKWAGY